MQVLAQIPQGGHQNLENVSGKEKAGKNPQERWERMGHHFACHPKGVANTPAVFQNFLGPGFAAGASLNFQRLPPKFWKKFLGLRLGWAWFSYFVSGPFALHPFGFRLVWFGLGLVWLGLGWVGLGWVWPGARLFFFFRPRPTTLTKTVLST